MSLVTSIPKTTVQFIRDSRSELAKVNWPTREQTIRYTTIVIVGSVAVGVIVGGIDYILTFILERFIL